jgi:hypothetical protein
MRFRPDRGVCRATRLRPHGLGVAPPPPGQPRAPVLRRVSVYWVSHSVAAGSRCASRAILKRSLLVDKSNSSLGGQEVDRQGREPHLVQHVGDMPDCEGLCWPLPLPWANRTTAAASCGRLRVPVEHHLTDGDVRRPVVDDWFYGLSHRRDLLCQSLKSRTAMSPALRRLPIGPWIRAA